MPATNSGITQTLRARPLQAACNVGLQFRGGSRHASRGHCPRSPRAHKIPLVSSTSLVGLALLGEVAARVGGARVTVGAMRVAFWGALAMGLTAGVGALFGTGA